MYMDFMTGEKLSSILLLTFNSFIDQLVHPVGGGDRWGNRFVLQKTCKSGVTSKK